MNDFKYHNTYKVLIIFILIISQNVIAVDVRNFKESQSVHFGSIESLDFLLYKKEVKNWKINFGLEYVHEPLIVRSEQSQDKALIHSIMPINIAVSKKINSSTYIEASTSFIRSEDRFLLGKDQWLFGTSSFGLKSVLIRNQNMLFGGDIKLKTPLGNKDSHLNNDSVGGEVGMIYDLKLSDSLLANTSVYYEYIPGAKNDNFLDLSEKVKLSAGFYANLSEKNNFGASIEYKKFWMLRESSGQNADEVYLGVRKTFSQNLELKGGLGVSDIENESSYRGSINFTFYLNKNKKKNIKLESSNQRQVASITEGVNKEKEAQLTLYFNHDSFYLSDDYKSLVVIPKHIKKLEIIGHTSSPGSETYNLSLSKKRSLEVFELLKKTYHIQSEQTTFSFKGERDLIYDQYGQEDQEKSRRVELNLKWEEK